MIRSLTQLRFLFAIVIFLCHYTVTFGTQTLTLFEHGGPLGVSFFFILSGFGLVFGYKDKIINNKISLKNFYLKRFFKLYPLPLLSCYKSNSINWLGSECRSVL